MSNLFSYVDWSKAEPLVKALEKDPQNRRWMAGRVSRDGYLNIHSNRTYEHSEVPEIWKDVKVLTFPVFLKDLNVARPDDSETVLLAVTDVLDESIKKSDEEKLNSWYFGRGIPSYFYNSCEDYVKVIRELLDKESGFKKHVKVEDDGLYVNGDRVMSFYDSGVLFGKGYFASSGKESTPPESYVIPYRYLNKPRVCNKGMGLTFDAINYWFNTLITGRELEIALGKDGNANWSYPNFCCTYEG